MDLTHELIEINSSFGFVGLNKLIRKIHGIYNTCIDHVYLILNFLVDKFDLRVKELETEVRPILQNRYKTGQDHRRSWRGITTPFLNFLFTYLLAIKFLYYFISFSLF